MTIIVIGDAHADAVLEDPFARPPSRIVGQPEGGRRLIPSEPGALGVFDEAARVEDRRTDVDVVRLVADR